MIKSSLMVGALLGGCWAPALAEPAPRSLDQALVDTLSLGNAQGCGAAFGIPDLSLIPAYVGLGQQEAVDTYLRDERLAKRLGNELAAVCGSSAVASAAALGGSLGSPQTTKTVSQFRMARARADSRLDSRGKRAGLERPVLLAQLGGGVGVARSDAAFGPAPQEAGVGMFTQVSHERRERATTALEAGYKAGVGEVLVGIDYAAREPWVGGAWLGYRSTDADYRNVQLLLGGANAGLGGSLSGNQGGVSQAEVCKIAAGGGFEDQGLRLGGFVATRIGEGFVDVGLLFSRRNYSYRRNVCAIEADGSALVPDPLSVSGFRSAAFVAGQGQVDDIYAGTVAGKTRLTEWGWSARLGFDAGTAQWLWGPRVSLSYLRTALGAYTETGRTSVTHRVESNNPAILSTTRTAGSPTGLELTFEQQRRTSLQSEVQMLAAYRHETGFGSLVPRVALSWQREFKGQRELVNVRMAQDFRANPTRFSFTTDGSDKSKGSLSLGLLLMRGPQLAVDLEVTRLLADDRFDSTQMALQAVWRF